MSFESLDWFYFIGLMIIPGILFAVYGGGITRFTYIIATSFICLLLLAYVDPNPFWLYGGIVISCLFAAYLSYIRGGQYADTFRAVKEKIQKLHEHLDEYRKNNVSLKDEIQTKEKGIERSIYMYSIVKGLAETINWESMIPVIGRALKRFLDAGEYALYLVEEDGTVRAYYRNGPWPSRINLLRHFSLPVVADPSWAVTSTDVENIPEGSIALPFLKADQIFGVLLVNPKKDAFKTQHDMLGEASSLQIQLLFGMERAKLYHDIEIRSLVDGLTHLYRRQYFDLKLEDEIIRAKSFSTPFSIVFIDVDHFKKVNDTCGHQMGDEVLSRLGMLTKTHVYETDFCARYGGEEFVIICPRAEREGLLRKIKSLHAKVQTEEFDMEGKKCKVTISIGIAHFPHHGKNAKAIISAADKALYAAKKAGRNRIEEYGAI